MTFVAMKKILQCDSTLSGIFLLLHDRLKLKKLGLEEYLCQVSKLT